MFGESDFSWSDDLIVVQSVDAIAVYTNTVNDVVIRQRDCNYDDPFVVIPRARVGDVIAALKALIE
jgi:hypothetical protein